MIVHKLILVLLLLSSSSRLCPSTVTGLQYGLDNSIYDEYDTGETVIDSSAEHDVVTSSGDDDSPKNSNTNSLDLGHSQQFNPKFGSANSLQGPQTSAYYNNYNIVNNKTHLLSSFVSKCRGDHSCSAQAMCDAHTGTCVKLCDIRLRQQAGGKAAPDCVYFHCDGKQLFSNDEESSDAIETNNYPQLSRYLGRRRCAWILKYANANSTKGETVNDSDGLLQSVKIPYAQLQIKRFSTEFANDFLYIFAGDSIYSPLVATLR
jgi:hypothetical protein